MAEFFAATVMFVIIGGALTLFSIGAVCIIFSWLAWAWHKLTS